MTPAKPFHLMAKSVGPRCNIDCEYCYYLDKERQYPDERKFRMPDAVLESYTRQMIETAEAAGRDEVLFAWHGGEPTISGVDWYRRALELQRKHAPAGMRVTNTMQTNGTLLDDEWGVFLAENGFLIGLSIDGPKAVHDRYRLDRAGRPTFDSVMRGLEVLQRHGVEHNLLCVVHRHNAGKAREIYRFLAGLGTPHLQFIPIVERRGRTGDLASAPQIDMDPENAVTGWSVSPRAYGKFLCDLFDLWFRRDIGRIHVQHFEIQTGLWLGMPSTLCVFAETCGDALVMEHNGDVYACDHYVYPEFRQGNIMDTPLGELVWGDRMARFGADKRDRLTRQCRECSYLFACNGGCPKHRFLTARDGEAGQNYFCESYMMFFRHAGPRLKQLTELIRAGRPAADIYALQGKRPSRPGRR